MAFGRISPHRAPPQGSGPGPMDQINVTPLVDVMLVLVVIFIMAAPMLAASLRVQLPAASAPSTPSASVSSPDALTLEVTADGQIWLQDSPADEAAAQQQLRELGQHNPDAEVQLRADTQVPYGRVVQVMGWAHAAGLTRIAFVTSPTPPATPAR